MRMVTAITKLTMMRYGHGNNCDDESTYAMWKKRIKVGWRDERWTSMQWNEKDDSKLVRLRME